MLSKHHRRGCKEGKNSQDQIEYGKGRAFEGPASQVLTSSRGSGRQGHVADTLRYGICFGALCGKGKAVDEGVFNNESSINVTTHTSKRMPSDRKRSAYDEEDKGATNGVYAR